LQSIQMARSSKHIKRALLTMISVLLLTFTWPLPTYYRISPVSETMIDSFIFRDTNGTGNPCCMSLRHLRFAIVNMIFLLID
jgi:hypothetical protein